MHTNEIISPMPSAPRGLDLDLERRRSIVSLIDQYGARIQTKKRQLLETKLPLIFDAAIKVSLEKGFNSMSLRDLCRETGLSMGGLYSYISNKEMLLEMVMDYGAEIVLSVLKKRLNQGHDAYSRLSELIEGHLELAEHMHDWFYFNFKEIRYFHMEAKDRAMNRALQVDNLLLESLQQGVEENIFVASVDLDIFASMIKAILQDWYMKRWKYKKKGVSVRDYHKHILTLIDASIGL